MVQHRVPIHEAVGGPVAFDGDGRFRESTVTRGQGHAESSADFEPGPGAASADGTGLVNRSELFGIALEVPAHEREVLVDPDEQAPAKELVPVATAHDDERLLVLRAYRIEQLRAVITATLPVGPDEGHGARVLVVVREGHALGQQRGDCGGVRAVLHRQQVARVVPRQRRQE